MDDTLVVERVVYAVLAFLAIILRGVGALGIGLVGGSALRRSVLREASVRFHTPLMFLGAAVLVGVIAFGTWSSPGTLALFGIGMWIGYMFLERRATPTVMEGEVIEVVEVQEESAPEQF